MKGQERFQQCYNAEIAVEEGSQLVVATGVTRSAGDNPQLLPMIEGATENTGKQPERVLADAGYRDERSFGRLEQLGIDAYVSLGREGKAASQEPAVGAEASLRMRAKLESEAGRAIYRRRKGIVEPAFGWAKERPGFRRFSVRGFEQVSGEWDLVCLAVNLKRLNSLLSWV